MFYLIMSEVLIIQKYTVAFYSLTKNHTLVDQRLLQTLKFLHAFKEINAILCVKVIELKCSGV